MPREVTVSDKGQLTLPKDLRAAWGIQQGDVLVFTDVSDSFVVTPKSIDFNDLAGLLGKPPKGAASLEQIDETISSAAGKNAAEGLSRAPSKSAA
jgi:AbrB family looped-hinge helix DNA binding protein